MGDNASTDDKSLDLSFEDRYFFRRHTIFRDFLGMKLGDSPVVLAPKASTDCRLSEPSPSASASLEASSGRGRGPISTTYDLGSGGHINPAVRS
ncbi:hypothetical protein EV1_034823 [Malus domestica]